MNSPAFLENVPFGRSPTLPKTAINIADEVKALSKRRRPAIVAEGQKLLSRAEPTELELTERGFLSENMHLFFNPTGAIRGQSAHAPARSCHDQQKVALA